MDYLNISQNQKCSKEFANTQILFSSYITDKQNRKKILVFTENKRIIVLSGKTYTTKRDIPVVRIRQISTSPGLDQVIVLHMAHEAEDKKDLLCAFLDENRTNKGEELTSRLNNFLNLLKIRLTHFDNTNNKDEYFRTASRINVSGKKNKYTLKFVCTSFPNHTDYLKFDIKGDIIKYHVPVLFGKQQIHSTNGLHVLDMNITDDAEKQESYMSLQL